MNIDRSLDDIIQESRVQRRAERAARRKATKVSRKQPQPTKPTTTTPAPNSNHPPSSAPSETRPANQPKLGPAKKRALITKSQKRRLRAKNRNQVSSDDLERDANPPSDRQSPEDTPRRKENGAGAGITGRLATAKPVRAGGMAAKGVKVAVSNLHPGVTETDIKELFETVGPLRRATLRTYASGDSLCEAEVVFEVMSDALEAIKRYNLVPLDNQPLHITLATDSVAASEGVHSRIGRPRGRGMGRKRISPGRGGYDDPEEDSEGGPAYANGQSPREDRPAMGGGQGRRFNNRRKFKRF
eukprot:GFKZ01001601.1.p1 GENE.GFKZ01001601.1~~GFKZ01001601.1.p1  ORF type:complete len:300 (-),score=42.15 GFKZ01001601.1:1862-2761(-)